MAPKKAVKQKAKPAKRAPAVTKRAVTVPKPKPAPKREPKPKAEPAAKQKPKPTPAPAATREPKPTAELRPKREPALTAEPKRKVPIAIVRLAEAFEQPSEALQCASLHGQLAKLSRARATAAAAGVLAHTTKGMPIARAYLTVVATPGDEPLAAADLIAKHCAKLDRDRKAMRETFVATWSQASDMRAVDAAYQNFARELLDDPRLLAAGVEAARRLGHDAVAADRSDTLERARRLAPVVKTASSSGIAGLAAEDRRHVYARVLDSPRSFDAELAIAAVSSLADDPTVPDASLSAAVADMDDHGAAELVAGWIKRVAAGESALITRLLGLFEWSALSATTAGELAPLIDVLRPAGGRPDVFAQVDGALASDNPAVREAVLDGWVRGGLAALDHQQVDMVIRSAIAIAEEGNDTGDRRAANRVLFDAAQPGACRALMDAIESSKTKRNPELRSNLYHGLAGCRHPAITPFLIARLFVEREAYHALMTGLAAQLDAATHRMVLAALAERSHDNNVVHAATAYAEVLVEVAHSPRRLVELAHAVIAWRPRNTDDGRRLRYLFEQALGAALALRLPGDANAFLARVTELPDRPYSDYRVHGRNAKTPALGVGQVRDQIAAVEQAIASDVEATNAARAARKPIVADDTQLGALAGRAVARRLLDDREAGVVWFLDELGELRVYDGFAVVPHGFTVSGGSDGLSAAGMAAFLGGKTIIDERVTFFDAALEHVREVIRSGNRVLVLDGAANVRGIGIGLPGYIAARDAVARFAANPPPGMKRGDSWTVSGHAVRREYETSSGGNARLMILGTSIEGHTRDCPPIERQHLDLQSAIRALQGWEGRLFASGGRLTKIWVDE